MSLVDLLHTGAVLLLAYLILAWLDEHHKRRHAYRRIDRLEQGIRAAVEREQDASRRAAKLDLELRSLRAAPAPVLGLPHHVPGHFYRN